MLWGEAGTPSVVLTELASFLPWGSSMTAATVDNRVAFFSNHIKDDLDSA